MPIISALIAAASIGTGIAGVAESAKNSGIAQTAAQTQDQIAQQELADKQKAFNQAENFYTPYTQQGSPFLQQIQGAAAGQNAQQFGNAAGQLRAQMGQTGLGFGPSGTTAAALGQLGQGAAQSSASNYLQNLLNNEQLKFQAQQGITNAANGVGGIAMPTNAVTQTTTGSSVNALGQSLANLAGKTNPQSQNILSDTTPPPNPLQPAIDPSGQLFAGGTPTTGGYPA